MPTRFVALLTSLAVGLSGVAPVAMAQPAAASLALPKDDALRAQPGAQPLAAPQVPPPPTAAEFKAAAARLAERFDRRHYDPWHRAAELGGGVGPAFEWVRDHVRFEAYPGAFRGAKGAYMARAANAADRSLLLAELLRANGYPTRFVTGRLPAERAAALFERVFEPAADGDAPPPGFIADAPAKKAFLERLAARARRDYAAVRSALGEALPAPSPTREQVLAEVADHVWVQAEVDGRWVDLDTAFGDAEVGRAYCDGGAPAEKLPGGLHQYVTIRVLAEHLDGGKVVTAKVLEVTKPVVDLVNAQVFLIHAPDGAGRGRGAAGFGGAVGGAFGGGGAADADPLLWTPVLSVGGETTKGTPVRFNDGTVAPAAPKRRGGFGGLAGDRGDDSGAPADASPHFVAEFLEFELTFPGDRRELTRRVLSDRAGPAWRAAASPDAKALRPLRRDDKGPVAPQVIHDIRFSAGCHDMAAYAADVRVLASAVVPPPGGAGGGGRPAPAAERAPPPGAGLDMTRQLWLLALQNLPVVAFGDQVVLPALNDDPAARFYVDSPRILVFSLGAAGTVDGKQASPLLEAEIDLRRDKVRGVARDAAAAPAVVRRKIWHGIVGGALEHEVAAEQAAAVVADVGDAADPSPAAVTSTSALLDAGGVVLIRPGDAAKQAVADLKLDPDTSLRLADALAGGEAVLVPAGGASGDASGAPGRGFWAVALDGGDTRAVWGDGGHMARMRSPLRHPGPQTYNPRAWVIDEKTLNSHREGGNEYGMIVYDTAVRTITYLELLYIIGAAIPWLTLAYRLWW